MDSAGSDRPAGGPSRPLRRRSAPNLRASAGRQTGRARGDPRGNRRGHAPLGPSSCLHRRQSGNPSPWPDPRRRPGWRPRTAPRRRTSGNLPRCCPWTARPEQHCTAKREAGGRPSRRETITGAELEMGSPAGEDIPPATSGAGRTTPRGRSQDRDRADAPKAPALSSMRSTRSLRESGRLAKPRMPQCNLRGKPASAVPTGMVSILAISIVQRLGPVTTPAGSAGPRRGCRSIRRHHRSWPTSLSLHGPNGVWMEVSEQGQKTTHRSYCYRTFCKLCVLKRSKLIFFSYMLECIGYAPGWDDGTAGT